MSNEQRATSLRQLLIISSLLAHSSWLAFAADSTSSALQHYQSGLAYERLGRFQDAYTQLQLAAALQPQESTIWLALGVVALRLGRDTVAQRALEQSITVDAHSVASYHLLALLYEKQKVIDRALDSWNRFLELSGDAVLKQEARKHIQYLEADPS